MILLKFILTVFAVILWVAAIYAYAGIELYRTIRENKYE